MAEIALQAAYKGARDRLVAADGVFETRVRVSMAKASTTYPYVIQFWQAGGEDNSIRAQDALLTIGYKCVSDKLADAMRGAAETRPPGGMYTRTGGPPSNKDHFGSLAISRRDPWLCVPASRPVCLYRGTCGVPANSAGKTV